MRVARPKSPVVDFSGWATVSLLFGVLGEGNGILFEDVDEDVIEEGFHCCVGVAERRASVLRRREVVGELLDFLDDIACARVLVLELLDEVERLFVRVRMLAHQREDELLFLGEVLLELGLEARVEVVEAREHLAVMRVVDDEDFVEKILRLGHEAAVRDMVRRLEVIEHLRDLEVLERLDVRVHILRRRRTGRDFVELREELLDVHAFLADGNRDGLVTAAAVVEMQAVEEPNRVRMRLDNIRECHILRDHTIASFAICAIRVVTGVVQPVVLCSWNIFSIREDERSFCNICYRKNLLKEI